MCCYGDKCLLCIPVEKGCLICAIIVAIGTGLTMLISFILGSLAAAAVVNGDCYSNYDNHGNYVRRHCIADRGLTVCMYMLALSSAVGFAFAVVLCNGISKRRPSCLKIYFVYGVVVIVLFVLAAIVMLGINITYEIPILFVLLCVPYSLFVVLVQQTYFKMLEGGNGAVMKSRDLMEI